MARKWKQILKQNLDISQNVIYLSYHLIKNNRLINLEKLDSKELCNIIISNTKSTPTSHTYFEILLLHGNFHWKSIDLLSRLVPQDSNFTAFQYMILNNILYLNKKLFQFGKAETLLCLFCKNSEETPMYFFQ